MFLAMMFLAFGGMAEVPIAVQARKVVRKQHLARMYGIPSFVLSNALVILPLYVLDTFVFGSIIYWYVHCCVVVCVAIFKFAQSAGIDFDVVAVVVTVAHVCVFAG